MALSKDFIKKALSHLPHQPGVYLMRGKSGAILYIGKAIDLRKRVANYFRPRGLEPKIAALMGEVQHIDYIPAGSERDALLIEQRLIKRHQPTFNTMWKDGKSYPYVKLSLGEDFPRLTLTRRRVKDGSKYYGPYPRVMAVRHLFQWLWKKQLFPLRPCKFEFSEKELPPYKKVKSCLYLHTGECPAPCVGKISKKDYAKIADKAVLFFEGKIDRLRTLFEKKMKAAAQKKKFEEAARLRDGVYALGHIREVVTFRSLKPEDVQSRIQASQALQELQTALKLPQPPVRIEAFDISHSQGRETVASMVTFHNGKPLKKDYRKFRIKTVVGVDDFASMEEVVERRYRRVLKEKRAWPDLILIDGGPGQLSSALKALKRLKKGSASIASLAKREEEVYVPSQKQPLRLPKSSPALQVLQHVRDESHRFAVSFHRQRRSKSMYNNKEEFHG